jgi:hypothetical protein
MVVSHAPLFTAKEYLALESVAETKHEFCGGRILSMAGWEAINVFASTPWTSTFIPTHR